jgi:hypothetical protein
VVCHPNLRGSRNAGSEGDAPAIRRELISVRPVARTSKYPCRRLMRVPQATSVSRNGRHTVPAARIRVCPACPGWRKNPPQPALHNSQAAAENEIFSFAGPGVIINRAGSERRRWVLTSSIRIEVRIEDLVERKGTGGRKHLVGQPLICAVATGRHADSRQRPLDRKPRRPASDQPRYSRRALCQVPQVSVV